MKLLAKVCCSAALIAIVAGCASDSAYIPKVPVGAQQALLDYEKLPGNKVFIMAVDPGGDFAYAFESGSATLKMAAKVAVEKIDVQREENGVVGRPYVYALNDKVVWGDMIRAAHKGSVEDERDAQVAEAAKLEAQGDVTEESMEEVAEEEASAM